MTTFKDFKWVMSSGKDIEFEIYNGDDTGALITENKNIVGGYTKLSNMKAGELYYRYSDWESTGYAIAYTVVDGKNYRTKKADLRQTDIKLRSPQINSIESVSSSNYKTEVERTEKLDVDYQAAIQSIFTEIKKDDSLYPSKVLDIVGNIQVIKKVRKRWASGTKKLKDVDVIDVNTLTGSLSFSPSLVVCKFIRLYDYHEKHDHLEYGFDEYSFPFALIFNSKKLGFDFNSAAVSSWWEERGINMNLGYYEATLEWIAVE